MDYCHNGKVWLTKSLFDDWIICSDRNIGRFRNKRVLLTLGNGPAHDGVDTILELKNVTVEIFPSRTTSEVQTFDAKIPSWVRGNYHNECKSFDGGFKIESYSRCYQPIDTILKPQRANGNSHC